MSHHGNFVSDTSAAMAVYARQCPICVDCCGLALLGRFLADTRLDPAAGARSATVQPRRTLLALMMTCGHYDGSGAFKVRVRLPAKSGVGGGILAIISGLGSIAVWSPNLDQQGNSILRIRALERLAERTGLSVFGPCVKQPSMDRMAALLVNADR